MKRKNMSKNQFKNLCLFILSFILYGTAFSQSTSNDISDEVLTESSIEAFNKFLDESRFGQVNRFNEQFNWHDDLLISSLKADKNYMRCISKDEKIVSPELYFDGSIFFLDGLMPIKKDYREKKWGYLNDKGMIAIPCLYDEADEFRE